MELDDFEEEFPALEKMAIKDIPKAKEWQGDIGWEPYNELEDTKYYDYNHLLPEHLRNDYVLQLQQNPGIKNNFRELRANLFKKGSKLNYLSNSYEPHNQRIGKVSALVYNNAEGKPSYADIVISELDKPHRGQKLGQAMYEAIAAHSLHHLKVKRLSGGHHSTLAHATHAALARKHGLKYEATQINDEGTRNSDDPYSFDETYGPYEYQIKSEAQKDDLQKALPRYNPTKDPYLEKPVHTYASRFDLKDKTLNQRQTAGEIQSTGNNFLARNNLAESIVNPNAYQRMLHRLRGTAKTRMGEEGLEYLLHRGIGEGEYPFASGGYYENPNASSWTPLKDIADRFGTSRVQAWIPEKAIHSVPFMWGNTFSDHAKVRPNSNKEEFEVIVRPGRFDRTFEPVEKALKPEHLNSIETQYLNHKRGIQQIDPKPHLESQIHQDVKNGWLKNIVYAPHDPESQDNPGGYQQKAVLKDPQTGKRYLIKPYWGDSDAPISGGWMEMTNQDLYHKMGIGHLHQKVITDAHVYPGIQEKLPSSIIELADGFKTLRNHVGLNDGFSEHSLALQNEEEKEKLAKHPDLKKILVMDYLIGNTDRHQSNLMYNPDTQQFLGIDHGEAHPSGNEYYGGDRRKFSGLSDRLLIPRILPEHLHDIKDWWHENKHHLIPTFDQHAKQLLDPVRREEEKEAFRRNYEYMDKIFSAEDPSLYQ